MPKIIEVIYEDGVFKPLQKVDLPEKTRLRIRVEAVKPAGIMEIAKEFRKSIRLEEILLEMRNRL